MADIDAFFANIQGDHRRWGERFAPHVVDGSPAWRIVRCGPGTATAARHDDDAEVEPPSRRRGVRKAPGSSSSTGTRARASSRRSRTLPESSSFETHGPAGSTEGAAQGSSGAAFVGVETYETDAFGDAPAGALVFPKAKNQKTKKDEAMDDETDDDEAEAAGDGGEEGGIDLSEYPPGSKVVRDWKGDPMVITPGDKLPFVS